jgi:hypothetical protein
MLVALITALSVTKPAHGTVLWKGDFQTGDFSQWGTLQEAATNRLQIVTNPAAPGERYAMQVTVDSGDVVSNGARAEATYEGANPAEGDSRYYHWQTYFPADFVAADYWQIFTQWHQYISGGSPPLAIMVWGNQIKLGNENNVYFWTGPLQLGEWHDFIIHVVWSSNATTGGVEVWYDGQHVLPFTSTATLFPGDTVYLKQGLYRKSAINYTQTLYHWGMTIATDLSDVLSSAPDAGAGPLDAGSVTPDAGSSGHGGGSPEVDAGSPAPPVVDAGTPYQDAGTGSVTVPESDAGTVLEDAGSESQAGSSTSSGSSSSPTVSGGESSPGKTGGCDSTGGSWALALLGLLGRLGTRRKGSELK